MPLKIGEVTRVQLHQRRHGARIVGRQPALAGKREVGRDRRPGVDLGSQLIERRAPFDAHGRDRRGAELIGDGSGAPARSKTKDASQRVTNRTAFANASPPGASPFRARLILGALDVGSVFGHDHDPRVPTPICGGTAVRTPLERIAGL